MGGSWNDLACGRQDGSLNNKKAWKNWVIGSRLSEEGRRV